MVVDEDGGVVESYDYFPFGLTARTGGSEGTIYKFTEKELDNETDFYYFGARYYGAEVGRWLSCDPLEQYPSPYIYCANNPLVYIDPSGMQAWEIKNQWDEDYERQFSEFVENYDISTLPELECADAQTYLRMLFAKEHNLPFELAGISANTDKFDSISDMEKRFEHFTKYVLDMTGTINLVDATEVVSWLGARPGDLFLLRPPAGGEMRHSIGIKAIGWRTVPIGPPYIDLERTKLFAGSFPAIRPRIYSRAMTEFYLNQTTRMYGGGPRRWKH